MKYALVTGGSRGIGKAAWFSWQAWDIMCSSITWLGGDAVNCLGM
jgi:hypothetical protein